MKIPCPNKNTKEWKDLEKAHGEAKAYVAYFRHNGRAGTEGSFPTVEQADKLLSAVKLSAEEEPERPPEGTTSLKNRVGAWERIRDDIARVDPRMKITNQKVIEDAKKFVGDDPAKRVVPLFYKLIRRPDMAVTPAQQLALGWYKLNLEERLEAEREKSQLAPDPSDKAAATIQVARIRDEQQDLHTVLENLGTTWSAFGRIRQIFLDADWSIQKMANDLAYSIGVKKLDVDMQKDLDKLNQRISDARRVYDNIMKDIQDSEAKAAAARSNAQLGKDVEAKNQFLDRTLGPKRVRRSVASIDAEIDSLYMRLRGMKGAKPLFSAEDNTVSNIAKFAAESEGTPEGEELNMYEVKRIAKRIEFLLYEKALQAEPFTPEELATMKDNGLRGTRRDLLDHKYRTEEIRKVLEDVGVEMSHEEVRDMLSGFGDQKPLTHGEVEDGIRAEHQVMQKASALDLVMKGAELSPEEKKKWEGVPPSGQEMQEQSKKAEQLQKVIREGIKEIGLETEDDTPQKQLVTAKESMRRRMNKEMDDLAEQISTGVQTLVEKGTLVLDPETRQLKDWLSQLRSVYEDMFKKEVTDDQWMKMAMKSTERSLQEIERRIRERDFSVKKGKPRPVYQEIEALKARRDERRAALEEMKRLAAEPKLDPRIVSDMAANEKAIAEMEAKIAAGDVSSTAKEKAERPTNDELVALKAKRVELSNFLAEAKKKSATEGMKRDEQRVSMAMKSTERSLQEIERRIRERDFAAKKGKPLPESKELSALRAKRDEQRATLEEMKRLAAEPKLDPRIVSDMAANEKAIAEMEAKIAAGDVSSTAKEKADRPTNDELVALKAKRVELSNFLAEAKKKSATEGMKRDAARVQGVIRRATEKIADLQDRMARGDFSTVPKLAKVKATREALAAKAALKKVEREWNGELEKHEYAKLPWQDRARAQFLKFRRFEILSSPAVLAKLSAAALMRMGTIAAEEVPGAMWRNILPKGMTEQATIEGGPALKALGKAMAESKNKVMADAWETLKTGHSELDYLYGTPKGIAPEWLEFFGRIHGALKAPIKRFAYEYAMAKQIEWAARNGVDFKDPSVEPQFQAAAYAYANRQIFMKDNRLVQAYRSALYFLEGPNKYGKTSELSKAGALFLRITMPIVTVPTNIVAEVMRYNVGLATGSIKLANAMMHGVKTLDHEQANNIMGDFKKGSLGGAIFMLGFLAPEMFGGLYVRGEKRDENDVKEGEMRIGGVDIPKNLLHHPLMEVAMIGSTIRRAMETKSHKYDMETMGVMEASMRAAIGLADSVPFIRETVDIAKLEDPNQKNVVWGELAKSLLVPQMVQSVAKKMDVEKRHPSTIPERIKSAVPILREDVPTEQEFQRNKKERRKGVVLDEE